MQQQKPTAQHELETRFCACGCEMWFRCLKSSSAKYASMTHVPGFNLQDFTEYTRHGRRYIEDDYEY